MSTVSSTSALGIPSIAPDINEHFLTHRSNYELATRVVYTHDRTPEEACAEILQRITDRDVTSGGLRHGG